MNRKQLIDYFETVSNPNGRAITVADINLIPDILAALRGPEWVRTADRMPEDDNFQMLIVYISDECFIGARYVWEVKEKPNKFQYYIPMPKLPEGEI